MSKKWTKWIPHEGDECPVDGDETVKVKNDKGCTGRGIAKHWVWSRQANGLTHYKRLKKNVEAERAAELKWTDEQIAEIEASSEDSTPLQPNRLPTPKPVITGPGEYVTAGGEKATIYRASTSAPGMFLGDVLSGTKVIPGAGHMLLWGKDGGLFPNTPNTHDITGPWQDPEAENPERWANLYRSESGEIVFNGAEYPSLQNALNGAVHYRYIGTVLLNPEEE